MEFQGGLQQSIDACTKGPYYHDLHDCKLPFKLFVTPGRTYALRVKTYNSGAVGTPVMDDSTAVDCRVAGFRFGECGEVGSDCCLDSKACRKGATCVTEGKIGEPHANVCEWCGNHDGSLCCDHTYCHLADPAGAIKPGSLTCNYDTDRCELCGHPGQLCCKQELKECVDGGACFDGRCLKGSDPDPDPGPVTDCSQVSTTTPPLPEPGITSYNKYCLPDGGSVHFDDGLDFDRCTLAVEKQTLVDEKIVPCHSTLGFLWGNQSGVAYTVYLKELAGAGLPENQVEIYPDLLGPFFSKELKLNDGQTKVYNVAVRAQSCGGMAMTGPANLGMIAVNNSCGVAPAP